MHHQDQVQDSPEGPQVQEYQGGLQPLQAQEHQEVPQGGQDDSRHQEHQEVPQGGQDGSQLGQECQDRSLGQEVKKSWQEAERDKHEKLRRKLGLPDPQCDVCGMLFRTIEDLFAHNREMDHGRWPGFWKLDMIQCKFCGYKFEDGGQERQNHLERKHYVELYLTCSDCGKIFSRKDHLQEHKLYAHS